MSEDRPHHHATTTQGARKEGNFAAVALQGGIAPLQCSATPSLPLWMLWVVHESPGVRKWQK